MKTWFILLQLFFNFLKTGLFSLGGGMATLPFLAELSKKYHWYTMEELTSMVAISESTPGPIGINMATFAGFSTAGIAGALVASLGLVFPSVVIILFIARFMKGFQENKLVKGAFKGLRPAVTALIAQAVWGVLRVTLFQVSPVGALWNDKLFIVTFLFLWIMSIPKLKKIHPGLFILVGAFLGIFFQL